MKRAGGGKIFWKTSDSDMPVTLEGRSMAMAGALTSQQTGTQGTTEQLALQMKSLFPLREEVRGKGKDSPIASAAGE